MPACSTDASPCIQHMCACSRKKYIHLSLMYRCRYVHMPVVVYTQVCMYHDVISYAGFEKVRP